jgi:ABC-2 type transport system permease protein
MSGTVHLRYEILRTLRNRTTFAVTLALPLVLYYAVAPANRHSLADGISFPLYFMAGMAAYGAMFAAVVPGAHTAADRSSGWTREMRITPLRPGTYFSAKVVTSYLVAIPTLVLLYLAGTTLGVRLDATQWLKMTGLLLLGLAPFVVLGIIIGHLASSASLTPVVGGTVVLFALLGGGFGDYFTSGVMHTIVRLLPSYWLVQAGKVARGGGGWPAEGWLVVAIWVVALIPLAVLAYRRDTRRG